MVGSIVGLLIGYFWTGAHGALQPLLYVLAALAVASAFALWFGIRDPARALSTRHVASHPESLFSRLRPSLALANPIPFFPHRPRLLPDPIGRLWRWGRTELHHELPLILLASFLFNLSANLFNISYTPYLVASGLVPASIFLVNLSNNFAQTLVFPATGPLANRIGADRLARRSTYARSLGYLATASFTFVALGREPALWENLGVYAVLGAAIAIYTTGSSLMLFRSLQRRDPGGLLGLNSALGGVAAVAGAALSFLLAQFGSFRIVFLVSAAILLASLPIWTAASVAYERRHRAETTAAPVLPAAGGGPAEPASAAKPH